MVEIRTFLTPFLTLTWLSDQMISQYPVSRYLKYSLYIRIRLLDVELPFLQIMHTTRRAGTDKTHVLQ